MVEGAVKAALDDLYSGVPIMDFSGGRNTEKDLQDLELNESPDCLNVKVRPGRLLGRGGYAQITNSLPSTSDGTAFFFDSAGNRRIVVWNNGNLYQVTFGIPVLVASGVYNAGNPIAWTTYFGFIYYSDGIIPQRRYNPVSNTEEAVPQTGAVPPPPAKVMATYAGSIVCGATTVASVFEPDTLRWCAPNDPGNYTALSLQAVGAGTGGEINSISNMGVSDSGVSPFRSLFVGKSQNGVFGLQGSLGATTEFLIPANTGVLDGRTVKFIPGPDGRAYVVWLGTDRKVWYSNGITADELSKPIRSELAQAILERIQSGGTPKFNAVVNAVDYQYVLDIGNDTYFVYDYDNQLWTKYEGWPSGYWTEGVDASGFPAIYSASYSGNSFNHANYGDSDNGSIIDFKWKTGYLNAGNAERLKSWDWLYTTFATDGGQLEITVEQGGTATGTKKSATGVITVPSTGASPFVLDASLLDGDDVLTAGISSTFTVFRKKARLRVPSVTYPGHYSKLLGSDVQVTFRQSQVTAHFELLGAKLLYLNRGYRRVG